MTSRLVTPWWLLRKPNLTESQDVLGSGLPTRILDFESEPVQHIVSQVGVGSGRDQLQRAHTVIAESVQPVYAVDELESVSATLKRETGSCSQRMAVLEAVARALGIRTRVRGMLVEGSFWYPRFPKLRFVVPHVVLLAWPEFHLDDEWVSVSELFAPIDDLGGDEGFSNSGSETLFDAVTRTAVDWNGISSGGAHCSTCDLSAKVERDLGYFDSRDELFAEHGQTLCWGIRTLTGPIMVRWDAGARAR